MERNTKKQQEGEDAAAVINGDDADAAAATTNPSNADFHPPPHDYYDREENGDDDADHHHDGDNEQQQQSHDVDNNDLQSLVLSISDSSDGSGGSDDDALSSSGSSSSTKVQSSNKRRNRDEYKEMELYVQKEKRCINYWRFVVVVGILIVGAIATWLTYKQLSNDQNKNFEKAFDQYATTIIESTNYHAKSIGDNYESFADSLVSYSSSSSVWPMFTIPDIEMHCQNLLDQTLSVGMFMNHYVADVETKAKWENYTMNFGTWYGKPFYPVIYRLGDDGVTPDPTSISSNGPWSPCWEMYPPPLYYLMNYDMLPEQPNFPIIRQLKHAIYGRIATVESGILQVFGDDETGQRQPEEPFSTYYVPLYDDFNKTNFVGTITGLLLWRRFFQNLLPDGINGIYLVLDSGQCNEYYTWQINGPNVEFIQEGDIHETKFDKYMFQTIFGGYDNPQRVIDSGNCIFSISVYPSEEFYDEYMTRTPLILSVVVGGVFVLVIAAFYIFDNFQSKRNNKILVMAATNSSLLTSSLFPTTNMMNVFRQRIMEDGGAQLLLDDHSDDEQTTTALIAQQQKSRRRLSFNSDNNERKKKKKKTYFASQNQRIKSFLNDDDNDRDQNDNSNSSNNHHHKSKPMAEYYPEVTIAFIDIVGFTAWCSVREPSQVFTLLESTYAAFDGLARRRRVFKVETVGDCYVAAVGIPDRVSNHAVALCRFCHACLQVTSRHFKSLETTLGPDTSSLTVRIGIHSGPVTAGILRGNRARFQLFGDTMNVAARMESTGMSGRIHVSEETARQLRAAGKEHWLEPRPTKVDIKGKGSLQSFWLTSKLVSRASCAGESSSGLSLSGDVTDLIKECNHEDKVGRLIEWHVDIFSELLKQIVSHRRASKKTRQGGEIYEDKQKSVLGSRFNLSGFTEQSQRLLLLDGKTCLDQVKEIIELPKFDRNTARYEKDFDDIKLSTEVVDELRNYIRAISKLYHNHGFHNFEHASHVTMSVRKLLSRIVMPSDLVYEINEDEKESTDEMAVNKEIASTLHDHTYGITSDPLTQFAVIFSALIHDVDHEGVPNVRLIEEKPELAAMYRNKSVAEQNSIVLSWDLLMEDSYANLRAAIYSNPEEEERFRQLVVQTVLATDIVDKELKVLRNTRWKKAFDESHEEENPQDAINRKATIVIEHLIQASDVSHTMQHWHVYRKWNENFFRECYKAFLDGRAEKDPSEFWYKGEIGFFDFYIIPLAKKLKDCGVFGTSSDEYLNYAMQNREEWEHRGREVVAEMLQNFEGTKLPDIAE